ncbi:MULTISPECIES: PadR family transcriptional regulator [unclassified Veillonella]|uniref:PadR family transcriptional regulator n=1 Tax=unclassified Veillonella TaxID=2630086 RepID=UPI001389C134|nr:MULTISPECIES: PadR family transcriptional regulator [unclassified Veillonella]KAF1683983.1 PadR family transcriptional regulator [Veillonella sp. R32]
MKTQLKKGVIELLVLGLLTQKNHYGYEIVDTISDYVEMSEGSIYPLLKRLQKDTLVETYWEESISGPPRKYYRITEIGKANYREMLLEWQEFSSAVNRFLEGVDQHD